MRNVRLLDIYEHHLVQKYLRRSGLQHAIAVSEQAFHLAVREHVNPDCAAKAGFLHDIGHYSWYKNGKWDFQQYRQNDIHAIKGAERAHRLLLRLGEDRRTAKEIALAILLHTDSYLPDRSINRTPLQRVVHLADEADEEPNGAHHYRLIEDDEARARLSRLDAQIEQYFPGKTMQHSG